MTSSSSFSRLIFFVNLFVKLFVKQLHMKKQFIKDRVKWRLFTYGGSGHVYLELEKVMKECTIFLEISHVKPIHSEIHYFDLKFNYKIIFNEIEINK